MAQQLTSEQITKYRCILDKVSCLKSHIEDFKIELHNFKISKDQDCLVADFLQENLVAFEHYLIHRLSISDGEIKPLNIEVKIDG